MAFDFPSPATSGQSISGPNGATWTYDGVKWRASAPWAGAAAIISDTAPVGQPVGTIWFDSVGLQSYVNYQDPNSLEYVPLINQAAMGILPMAVVPDSPAPWNGPVLTGYSTPPTDNRSAYAAFAARRYASPVGAGHQNWDGGTIGVFGPNYSDDGVTTSPSAGGVWINTGSNLSGTRHTWHFWPTGDMTAPGNLAIAGWSIPSGIINGNFIGNEFVMPNGGNISANLYGADTWRYYSNGAGGLYAVRNDGAHYWYSAPSGSTGAAASLTTTLRLNPNGDLLANNALYAGTYYDNGLYLWKDGNGNAMLNFTTDGWRWYWRNDGTLGYINYAGTWLFYSDGSGNITTAGGATINGSITVTGYMTNTGARIISQGYNNNPSVTVYNTIWGAACMFLDASGNLSFGAADGNGTPQNYCYFNANNAGGLTCGYLVASNGWGVKYTSGAYNSSNNFLFGWNNVVGGLATVSIDNGGAVYAMANGSDARIKTNIAPSTYDCLDTVLRLPLVEYDLLDIPDTWELRQAKHPRKDEAKRRVGMVAQKVYDIFPEGVRKGDDFDDHLGIVWGFEHNNLVALLVGAMQQLSAEVAELKARHGG